VRASCAILRDSGMARDLRGVVQAGVDIRRCKRPSLPASMKPVRGETMTLRSLVGGLSSAASAFQGHRTRKTTAAELANSGSMG